MNKKSKKILIDCHLDIAYSIRANRRNFEDISPKFMISYDQLKKAVLIFFSQQSLSHIEELLLIKKRQLSKLNSTKKILKDYHLFYQILTNNNLKKLRKIKSASTFQWKVQSQYQILMI